jgi:hypothetical protein
MSEKTTHDLEIEILELKGKFELLNQVVLQQKERLDNSSATGFKAWEAFQRMEGEIGGLKVKVDNLGKDLAITDEKAKDAGKWAKDAHIKYDGFNTKILWAILLLFIGIIIKFLATGRLV